MDRARIRSSSKGRRRAGVVVVAAAALAMFVFAAPAPATGIDDRFQNIADPSAAPTWTLQINGAGASLDAATAVLADGSGAYIGGWAGNAAGNWDATLTRVSSTGVRKWLKRWDSSVHKNDLIWKLAKGPSGSVYGAGWTVAANDKTNILVIKWAADGTRKWTRTYDGAAHGGDTAAALGVDKYGNVTVVGSSKGAHGQDYVVIKWASNGTRKFVWRYDGAGHADDAATDVRVESGGTTYVTGNIKTAALKDATYTVKFSSSGSKVWGKPYLGPSSLGANATSIAARPAGGVYIAGWSLDAVTGMDAMVARYTSTGSGQVLPPPSLMGDDSFADLAVTSNKIVVGVGSYTVGANVQSMWLRWGSETAPPVGNPYGGGFADAFTACTADSSGGVYYTGYERTAVNQSQIRTNRTSFLDMSSGFESLWGPALGADTSTGIAASGTVVYVVGTTYKDAIDAYNQVVLIYVY